MKEDGGGGGGWYPEQWLMEPVPKDVAGSWGDVNDWYDTFNPSLGSWAMKAWEKFSGDDIGELWGKELAGDWEEVAKLADALTNLGKFCGDYERAMTAQIDAMDTEWDGMAAQDAALWFTSMSVSLTAMKENLDEAADGFNEAALGIHECFEAVKSGIETLIDLAISIGIGLAATAAASSTLIGGLVAGSATVAAVATAVSKVGTVKSAIEAAVLAARGLIGVIAALVGPLGDFTGVSTPGEYDHRNFEPAK